MIGDEIGEFLELESEGEGPVAGRFLRLKIRLDKRKTLRRGIMMGMGADKEDRWCPIAYEFLPEFCYVCGLIGHVDRMCRKRLGPGEKAPFSKKLRYIPLKWRIGGDG